MRKIVYILTLSVAFSSLHTTQENFLCTFAKKNPYITGSIATGTFILAQELFLFYRFYNEYLKKRSHSNITALKWLLNNNFAKMTVEQSFSNSNFKDGKYSFNNTNVTITKIKKSQALLQIIFNSVRSFFCPFYSFFTYVLTRSTLNEKNKIQKYIKHNCIIVDKESDFILENRCVDSQHIVLNEDFDYAVNYFIPDENHLEYPDKILILKKDESHPSPFQKDYHSYHYIRNTHDNITITPIENKTDDNNFLKSSYS